MARVSWRYECTVDCSGHGGDTTGPNSATSMTKMIAEETPESFIEGCKAFVQENTDTADEPDEDGGTPDPSSRQASIKDGSMRRFWILYRRSSLVSDHRPSSIDLPRRHHVESVGQGSLFASWRSRKASRAYHTDNARDSGDVVLPTTPHTARISAGP